MNADLVNLVTKASGLLDYQWGKFFGISTAGIGPSTFYGYGGATFAFVLSFMGAIDNLSQTVVSVENAIDNWMAGYSDGNYINVVKEVETSEAMQAFLLTFTLDMIFFVLTSIVHSIVILWVGYGGAYWIMNKMVKWQADYKNSTPPDVPIDKGYRALLLGVLIGTIGYLAGTTTQGVAETVMLSLGFTDHSYTDQALESVTMTVTPPVGAASTSTNTI